MTDDIAALIEEAEHSMRIRYASWEGVLEDRLISALRTLAQENERLNALVSDYRQIVDGKAQRIRELEAIAKCDGCGKSFDENGGICEPCHSAAISGHIRPLGQRIAELEAERDDFKERARMCLDLQEIAEAERDRLEAELRVCYKLPFAMGHPVAQKLVAERAAIRAKTIEECAIQVAIFLQSRIGEQAAAAIRALAQTDEKVDTSDIPEKGEGWFEKAKLVTPSQGG